jgi:hypothetical protein
MNERNRATTLRLRTPTAAPAVGSNPPRSFVGAGPRAGLETRMGQEPRRAPLQTYIPNRPDPTSRAIMDELAALGLADPEERD